MCIFSQIKTKENNGIGGNNVSVWLLISISQKRIHALFFDRVIYVIYANISVNQKSHKTSINYI